MLADNYSSVPPLVIGVVVAAAVLAVLLWIFQRWPRFQKYLLSLCGAVRRVRLYLCSARVDRLNGCYHSEPTLDTGEHESIQTAFFAPGFSKAGGARSAGVVRAAADKVGTRSDNFRRGINPMSLSWSSMPGPRMTSRYMASNATLPPMWRTLRRTPRSIITTTAPGHLQCRARPHS